MGAREYNFNSERALTTSHGMPSSGGCLRSASDTPLASQGLPPVPTLHFKLEVKQLEALGGSLEKA